MSRRLLAGWLFACCTPPPETCTPGEIGFRDTTLQLDPPAVARATSLVSAYARASTQQRCMDVVAWNRAARVDESRGSLRVRVPATSLASTSTTASPTLFQAMCQAELPRRIDGSLFRLDDPQLEANPVLRDPGAPADTGQQGTEPLDDSEAAWLGWCSAGPVEQAPLREAIAEICGDTAVWPEPLAALHETHWHLPRPDMSWHTLLLGTPVALPTVPHDESYVLQLSPRVLQLGLDRTEVSPGFSLEWYVDGLDLGTRDTALAHADRLTVWAVVGDDVLLSTESIPPPSHPAPRHSTLWRRGVPHGPLRGVAADLPPLDTLVHTADGPALFSQRTDFDGAFLYAGDRGALERLPLSLDEGDRLVAGAPATTTGRLRGGETGAPLWSGLLESPTFQLSDRRVASVLSTPILHDGGAWSAALVGSHLLVQRDDLEGHLDLAVACHTAMTSVRLLPQGDVLTLVSAVQGHERAMPFTLEPW
jgi:hypothetical protein